MTVKVTVKGRFVYNGKVYGSLEELPENVRQAYVKATTGSAAVHPGSMPGAKIKIVFNGTEYESLDAMPPEERRVYESVIGAVETGHVEAAGGPGGIPGLAPGPSAGTEPAPLISSKPIEPGSAGSRRTPIALALGLALLLFLLAFYLLSSGAGK